MPGYILQNDCQNNEENGDKNRPLPRVVTALFSSQEPGVINLNIAFQSGWFVRSCRPMYGIFPSVSEALCLPCIQTEMSRVVEGEVNQDLSSKLELLVSNV